MGPPRRTRAQLLDFALGLPGAWLDHPWGEDVAKVGTKVFVFLGLEDWIDESYRRIAPKRLIAELDQGSIT